MAVINCPECNGKVSKFADFCPHCGINKKLIESILIQKQKEKQEILDAQEVDRPEEINKTKKIPSGGGGLKTPLHDRLLRASMVGVSKKIADKKKEQEELKVGIDEDNTQNDSEENT